jgi:hypothetical protein
VPSIPFGHIQSLRGHSRPGAVRHRLGRYLGPPAGDGRGRAHDTSWTTSRSSRRKLASRSCRTLASARHRLFAVVSDALVLARRVWAPCHTSALALTRGTAANPALRETIIGLDLYGPVLAPCLLGRAGTPRHYLTPFGRRTRDSRHRTARHGFAGNHPAMKIECRRGLLIRGFGVQVPGGAPVLTWG